MGEFLGTFFFL